MAELKRGVKSGATGGIIYGIIFAIIGIIYTYTQLAPSEYIVIGNAIGLTIGYAIGGAIAGVIFGLVYAAAYSHLPGTSIVRGLCVGIIWWLVMGLGVGYLVEGTLGVYHIASSLILALIWGALVGFFWGRYGT